MSGKLIFCLIFFISSTISGYDKCLNEDPVTEECIKRLYENGDYHHLLKYIDDVKFKERSLMLEIKADSLFKSADYSGFYFTINKLPSSLKDSLYYQVVTVKAAFAMKRFAQVLEMIDSIKEQYPLYYIYSGLECTAADIMLYRKQYDSALETYDRCIKYSSNASAQYNRIISLEKNGPPSVAFFKDYIEFLENNRESHFAHQVVERLVKLKKEKDIPSKNSAYFSRWLDIMRRSSKLDTFFNDDMMKLDHPANLEIVRYLSSKKRFSDALKIVDEALVKYEKDVDVRYTYVVEKYRLLANSGDEKGAADFMVAATGPFSENRNDRLLFFAGTYYFDAGFVAEGKHVFEEIVYKRPSSKYFLLALYKLGLIYLNSGNDLFTFTLWTNYVYDSDFSHLKYIGGNRVYGSIEGIIQTIDRLNGFCTYSTEIEFECPIETICENRTENRFISYYDFLYFHLTGNSKLNEISALNSLKSNSEWKKRSLNISVTNEDILKKINDMPKYLKKVEPVTMIERFLKYQNRDGVEFYLEYIRSFLNLRNKSGDFTDISFPEKESADDMAVKFTSFLTRTDSMFSHYFNNTGDLADYYYNIINSELSFAPHHGKEEDWKKIYPTPFINEISKLSEEFGVPLQLIYSIMRAETFYRPDLTSPAGALGLMQVMPSTFQKISKFAGIKIKDPLNPYDSMKASVWYLSKLLKRFDNDYAAAIAAYNAGPVKVSEWVNRYKGMEKYIFIEMIPFYETRNYVKKVLRYMEIYSWLYEGIYYDFGLKGVINIDENPEVVNF